MCYIINEFIRELKGTIKYTNVSRSLILKAIQKFTKNSSQDSFWFVVFNFLLNYFYLKWLLRLYKIKTSDLITLVVTYMNIRI